MSITEIVSACSCASARSILLVEIICSISSMLSLSVSIMVLRAMMTSSTLAALWSCANATRLVPQSVAANAIPAIAPANARRPRAQPCLKSLILHSTLFPGHASTQHNGSAQEPDQAFGHQEGSGDVGKDRPWHRELHLHQDIGQQHRAHHHDHLRDFDPEIEAKQKLREAVIRKPHVQ